MSKITDRPTTTMRDDLRAQLAVAIRHRIDMYQGHERVHHDRKTVADRLHITETVLSLIMNNHLDRISTDTLLKIANSVFFRLSTTCVQDPLGHMRHE